MQRERVKIRKDEYTTNSKAIGAWEIAVLEHLFGDGNVQPTDTFEQTSEQYPDAKDEFHRLGEVYGRNPESGATYVSEVYGNGGLGVRALRRAITEAQAEAEEMAEKPKVVEPPKPAKGLARKRARAEADSLLS